MFRTKLRISALLLLACATVQANDRFTNVEINATEVAPGIHMLTGAGGNIGVSSGDDGILIIDDQFAPLADKITAALAEISPKSKGLPRFVVNTHHHGDHTGGNAHFSQHATVVAHHNVLKHLQQDDKVDAANYPVMTYQDGVTFHFNNQKIEVLHQGIGHTDGDSMVYFPNHNVLHMGDLFFNGTFPFVDIDHGGSVRHYLARVEDALAMTDDNTIIIPGHGKLAKRKDLLRFRQMLIDSLTWAEQMPKSDQENWLKQGLPEALKSWQWRFITEQRWIETLWREVQG